MKGKSQYSYETSAITMFQTSKNNERLSVTACATFMPRSESGDRGRNKRETHKLERHITISLEATQI
jgi:hypothetical protein